MAKIYNEIVIDMNPESSSFEEVLHEDSFEYSGDMILAQGDATSYEQGDRISVDDGKQQVKAASYVDSSGNHYATYAPGRTKEPATFKYPIHEWNGSNWVKTEEFTGALSSPPSEMHYANVSAAPSNLDITSDKWGAGTISKDDFIDPTTGQPRSIEAIKGRLGPKLPGITEEALEKQIADMAPKYTEDVYGMGKEKEFAKQAYEQDIYGLQKGARKIGGAMRGVYGGSGAGMRAGIGAAGALGTQFAQAGQEYGKSMYDIEQAGIEKYEEDITGWLDPEWFKAKEGGYVKRDGSGISNNLEETFLDALTKLPDAGGS